MNHNAIVSREEWLDARKLLLAREKEFTRARDELSRQRREQPWVEIDKPYEFDSPTGKVTLAQLFNGRSQLFIKHFMMEPGQKWQCEGCTLESNHVDGLLQYFENRDMAYVAVSRAQIEEIEVVRRSMGWKFCWVSSYKSEFNYDFHVSFRPEEVASGKTIYNFRENKISPETFTLSGHRVFYKNAQGEIFRTYGTFGRGSEQFMGIYGYFDVLPKGREEYLHGLVDWANVGVQSGTNGHEANCGCTPG